MPVAAGDIQRRLSGGATNTNPALSLGGAKSDTSIASGTTHNLFDAVSPAEASAGDVEYRGIYIHNAHASLTLQDARIYISTDGTGASDALDIAMADEAVDIAMETIPDENTAPVGPVFSAPTTYTAGLVINGTTGLAAGSARGVWYRRTVAAGAPAGTSSVTVRVEGQSA